MSALGEIHITLKPPVLQQGPWEEDSISVGAARKENDPLLGNTVLFLRFEVNHWDFWNISDGSCMTPSVLFKYACKAEESGFAYPSHDNIWELTLCLKASRPSISVQWINRWVSRLVHKWGEKKTVTDYFIRPPLGIFHFHICTQSPDWSIWREKSRIFYSQKFLHA